MRKDEDFFMLPTVDFCFHKLMQNAKVRKGFVAALLKVSPESIQSTELLPTMMHGETPGDKLGILDVRIRLRDGTQMKKGDDYDVLKKCIHVSILDFVHFPDDDVCYRSIHLCDDKTGKVYSDKMEIQVLELRKLPKDVKTGDDIITWMKFFSGKSRKEFEDMAKTNEYIDEAYDTLRKLSADDIERMQYEAREKAIRDYNSQMNSARRSGLREG